MFFNIFGMIDVFEGFIFEGYCFIFFIIWVDFIVVRILKNMEEMSNIK